MGDVFPEDQPGRVASWPTRKSKNSRRCLELGQTREQQQGQSQQLPSSNLNHGKASPTGFGREGLLVEPCQQTEGGKDKEEILNHAELQIRWIYLMTQPTTTNTPQGPGRSSPCLLNPQGLQVKILSPVPDKNPAHFQSAVSPSSSCRELA